MATAMDSDQDSTIAESLDNAVMEVLTRRPGREWEAARIASTCQMSVVDVVAALVRLVDDGRATRIGPGRYKA